MLGCVHLDKVSYFSKLHLSNKYYDSAEGKDVEYKITKKREGLLASFTAGLFSGMLGIGGGVLKVPMLNQ